MTSIVEQVRANLARHSAPDLSEYETLEKRKRAAVLMPLILDEATDSVHIVLSRRALTLRTHPGEVAFPGGRMDPEDPDGAATAIREANEEIGLDPSFVQVATIQEPAISLHKLLVTPVAAYIDCERLLASKSSELKEAEYANASLAGKVIKTLTISPDEVHSVFSIPLDTFLLKKCHEQRQVDASDGSGAEWKFHVFTVTDEFGREYHVWGLTAHFVVEFARLAFGRDPEMRKTEQVLSNLRAYKAPIHPEYEAVDRSKRAAVLLPVILDHETDTIHVILTQRASKLRTHSGEVALPGGRMDADDESIIATALREAAEEIGLNSSDAEVVSVHEPAVSLHRILVTPVCAIISNSLATESDIPKNVPNSKSLAARIMNNLTLSPDEVEHVFTVPLHYFLESRGHSGHDIVGDDGTSTWKIHRFQYVDEFGRSFLVWGMTSYILVQFAKIAFGEEPEFQAFSASERPTLRKKPDFKL
ncbi:hypothetical protein BCR33DRAFT_857182 [Rhizoclosmatium globosum]|uniref:Nudix hydrolase domain-containing protein n=1 Tax=Rhizoclosmatium globosum TaxID=329046 RepID=A0A1Y2B8V8_9FUNG|nr:hypothetical protein BCR33DRAFT_857182 [Rhizoclosmatium globosum]|eukprot:ORY30927.1 hypothetical protein BCR33DRAFT_857182 [Rhizoclosmatium globosum]